MRGATTVFNFAIWLTSLRAVSLRILGSSPPSTIVRSRPLDPQPPCDWKLTRASAILLSSGARPRSNRSEEHTSELQSLMRISYAVFCLKKKKNIEKKKYMYKQQVKHKK